MSRRVITNACVIPASVFLLLVGLIHGVVNVTGMSRAIERGDIAPRFRVAVLMNAAFSGLALSLLGVIVLLHLAALRAGSRRASHLAAAVGTFVAAVGVGGYLWVPASPTILIFFLFGTLLAAPLLIWRRQFSNE
ncbi:MAG: hypothetical protein FJW20_17360 [Acidimicrobiia bacterium]|nr:hypothetical protein [Acidimicrobiia bacterium]